MICVFGSINVDLVCRVAEIARPGETVLSPGYGQYPGGKGANQAVAAARMGAAVEMVGAVGADAFGEMARANLERNGVGTAGVSTVGRPTGCAFIVVADDGENAITVASGANLAVSGSDRIGASTFVTQMELATATVLRGMEAAKRSGAGTILNFAPVPSQIDGSELRSLLQVTDYLVVNQHELVALCASLGIEADGQALAEQARCQLIVTRGGEGIVVHGASVGREAVAMSAPKVDVIDTTGAGDTFVGALAAGLDAGVPLQAAARRAMYAATLACRCEGAQSAMPTDADLDQLEEDR